jgi:NADPH:quinone reductase-like Zn-dependent oxidoreductase
MATTGVKPLIDTVVPLREARAGFEKMHAGDLFGKVVFTV